MVEFENETFFYTPKLDTKELIDIMKAVELDYTVLQTPTHAHAHTRTESSF